MWTPQLLSQMVCAECSTETAQRIVRSFECQEVSCFAFALNVVVCYFSIDTSHRFSYLQWTIIDRQHVSYATRSWTFAR